MAYSSLSFKTYARGRRVDTSEEDFGDGSVWVDTPLSTGKNKTLINFDMINDDKNLRPRRGIRTTEIALCKDPDDSSTPQVGENIKLTSNLDAVEEDNHHYQLYIANNMGSSEVGVHSGNAQMLIVDADEDLVNSEEGVDFRNVYAIPCSYQPDEVLDAPLTIDNLYTFCDLVQFPHSVALPAGSLMFDNRYIAHCVFKARKHPGTVGNCSDLCLAEAELDENGVWVAKTDPVAFVNAYIKPDTYYMLFNPSPTSSVCADVDNPYITFETSVEGGTVTQTEPEVGTLELAYNDGTLPTISVDSVGVSATVTSKEKLYSHITEPGEYTFSYVSTSISEAHTFQNGGTVTIDEDLFSQAITESGTTMFIYDKNRESSITCSTSGASIELDIYRFNKKVPTAGTTTFTYSTAAASWQLSSQDVNLAEYGIRFKDPNAALANGATIKIVTATTERWRLDDDYIQLADYGISISNAGTFSDGDTINVKSISVGTWQDAEDNFLTIADYGIEVLDPKTKLRTGDTMTFTITDVQGWYDDGDLVSLDDLKITLKHASTDLETGDTITITRTEPTYNYSIPLGRAVHEIPGSMYYIPRDAEANGYSLASDNRAAKAIGCFAWNNNYYNFNSHGELIRTRYDVETTTYYSEVLEPKEIKASEALSSGFNMLSDDPYTFSDVNAEGDINLVGMLLYDMEGNLQAEPLINTSYKLRCFYEVEEGAQYKIKFDYRETNTSDWIDIQEDEYTFDTLKEVSVKAFACPVENAILRVQAFKWEKEPTVTYTTNVANASIVIDNDTLKKKFENKGTYNFYWDGSYWQYGGKAVELSDYGITYTDVASALTVGSLLSITISYKWQYAEDATKTQTMSVAYAATASTDTANRDLLKYDLSKCKGMVYWKGHLWLYGLDADPTVLFCSDTNEPAYFPYPNNIDILDEPVMGVIPFNEYLLVITRTTMYKLTLNEDGSWTKTIIQGSLNFTEFDMNLVKVVKNMLFFKSGTQYYMVVPKTLSLQNELAIAPVSKNIELFLDNMQEEVPLLLSTIYSYEGEIEFVQHYNFLNYEDVFNVYVYRAGDVYVNLGLIYSTTARHWRFYIWESQEIYLPVIQDATKTTNFYAPLHYNFRYEGTLGTGLGVQILEVVDDECSDFYITDPVFNVEHHQDRWTWTANARLIEDFQDHHFFKNYTYLDTGYRDINTDHKKRCREVQFKFNNVAKTKIQFFTEFLLDGEKRKWYYTYNTEQIQDPDDPDFGLIYIDKQEAENLELPGANILDGESILPFNAWELDASRFPDVNFWKARLKVSGKNYTPRVKLLCRSTDDYNIIGYTWTYRDMYSR